MRVLKLFVGVLLLFGGLSGAQAEQEPGQQDFHPTIEQSIIGPVIRSAKFLYGARVDIDSIPYRQVGANLFYRASNRSYYVKGINGRA